MNRRATRGAGLAVVAVAAAAAGWWLLGGAAPSASAPDGGGSLLETPELSSPALAALAPKDAPAAELAPESTDPTPEQAAWLREAIARFPKASLREQGAILQGIATLGPRAAAAMPFLDGLIGAREFEGLVVTALTTIGVPAVPSLLRILAHAEDPRRIAVVRVLGAIHPTSADVLARLVSLLSDPSEDMRAAAATALGSARPGSGEIVDTLLGALRDASTFVRVKAAHALGAQARDGPRVLPVLAAILADPGQPETLRVASITAALAFDDPGPALDGLVAAAGGEALLVWEAALDALRRRGPHAGPAVRGLLAIEPRRREARGALSEMAATDPSLAAHFESWIRADGSSAGVRGLLRLGREGAIRIAAAYPAGGPENPEWLPTDVRGFEATPTLLALESLLGSSDALALWALASLEQIGDEAARSTPAVAAGAGAGPPGLRRGRVETLAAIGRHSATAASAVATSLEDPVPSIRLLAVLALESIDVRTGGLIDALSKRLRDDDPEVALAALGVLRRWGERVPAAKAAYDAAPEEVRATAKRKSDAFEDLWWAAMR